MKKINSERKAAEKARGVLALLSPTAAYADHIVHPLRRAASVASSALQGTSERKSLNKLRTDVTVTLDVAVLALQTRTLTHKIINDAQAAVDEWLAGNHAA